MAGDILLYQTDVVPIGAEKARKESDPTLERMYDVMGFVKSQNGRHFGAARPRGL